MIYYLHPRATKIIFMKKLLVLSIIALLALSSCKKWQHKYPEDTERTKDTATERLTDKWWTLKSAYVNGSDYTNTIHDTLGKFSIFFSNNLYETSLNGNKIFYGTINTELDSPFTILWSFINNETQIFIGRINGNTTKSAFVPQYYPTNNNHTIMKLTSSEMKIVIEPVSGLTIINIFTII